MLMWRAFCVNLLQQEPFWLQTCAPMHSFSSNRSVPPYRQLKQQTHYSEDGSCGTEVGSLRTTIAPQSHPRTCTSLEAAMEFCVNLHNVLNIECFPYWLQLLCVLQYFFLWSIRPENRFPGLIRFGQPTVQPWEGLRIDSCFQSKRLHLWHKQFSTLLESHLTLIPRSWDTAYQQVVTIIAHPDTTRHSNNLSLHLSLCVPELFE